MTQLKRLFGIILQYLKDPVFLICILIASFMWLLNKLNGDYTANLTLPVEMEGAVFGDRKSIEGNVFDMDCTVRGSGYTILSTHLMGKIRLTPNEVKWEVSKDSSLYVVNNNSLEQAIAGKLKNLSLVNMYAKRIAFQAITFERKRVPVRNRIETELEGKYMQIGKTVLQPDSVWISGDKEVIGPISYVQTHPLKLRITKNHVSGNVSVESEAGVTVEPTKVYYAIEAQRYTEKRATVKLEIDSERFDERDFSLYPAEVTVVFNVSEGAYPDFDYQNIRFSVDVDQPGSGTADEGENRYTVKFSDLPEGVEVLSVEPASVIVLRNLREP